jgi:histone deacetylase complex regulatory component SIN3
MDASKFEDLARQLIGHNAFLLFQIDKIINQMMKQLLQLNADQNSKRAIKLYQETQLAMKDSKDLDFMARN